MGNDPLEPYWRGDKLYGDDFALTDIEAWFADEHEGYASLWVLNRADDYTYGHDALNTAHGFQYLNSPRYAEVLSVGGAYGDEIRPIQSKIGALTILDPSEAYLAREQTGFPVKYVKPQATGIMPFADETFDLVTCFGCLHHIPNVTTVVKETFRCLKIGGMAIIREPIVSMGDWRHSRNGLTKRERGIPLPLFQNIGERAGFHVVKRTLCGFPIILRLQRIMAKHPYNSRVAVSLDSLLCGLFAWNYRYHPRNILQKLTPSAACFVLQKRSPENRKKHLSSAVKGLK